MKIKVKDLEPNPFRKIKEYPFDKAKIEALKTSIKEKTFWDNIIVRKRDNKYELAYGHHRWQALLELGIKEIDVPVRNIDDATMVQIMAEENLNWSTSTAVMTQTVLIVKEFLDKELKKHKTWKDCTAGENAIGKLFPSEIVQKRWVQLQTEGVGRHTLIKFLGGNWTRWGVRTALDLIKDKEIDKEAIQKIPTLKQAKVFRREVRRHNIPKPTQKKIAKQIAKEETGFRHIPDLVAEHAPIQPKEKPAPKPLPNLEDVVRDTALKMGQLYTDISHIGRHISNLENKLVKSMFLTKAKALKDKIEEVILITENQNETKRRKIQARTN